MADIEKALPNINNKVEVERPELEVDLVDQGTDSDMPFDVTPLDDGGVELDFEPGMQKFPEQKTILTTSQNYYQKIF